MKIKFTETDYSDKIKKQEFVLQFLQKENYDVYLIEKEKICFRQKWEWINSFEVIQRIDNGIFEFKDDRITLIYYCNFTPMAVVFLLSILGAICYDIIFLWLSILIFGFSLNLFIVQKKLGKSIFKEIDDLVKESY